MSYMSTGIGPSPFLSTSRNHFHHDTHTFSSHPHYHTNSYTNSSSYVFNILGSTTNYNEENKYFPSQIRNVFNEISKLQTEQNQKILNPLNTYSGNVFSTSKVTSPFDRGEIYYGRKSKKCTTLEPQFGVMNSQLETYLYGNMKQNPFNKKYLLTEKNQQLENYAFYSTSTISSNFQETQPIAPRKRKVKNLRKLSNQRQDKINEYDTADYVLKMTTKYDKKDQNQEIKKKPEYNSSGNIINPYNPESFQPVQKVQYKSQRQQKQYLVQSEVDEKQFDSFGQGKQLSRQNIKVEKINPSDSLIMGLAKMAATESNPERYRQQQSKLRREPVFIESEDDQRKSGTFKVPEAIIDEINNQRIPSTVLKKMRQKQSALSIQRSVQMSEKGEKKNKQSIKVNQNPPKIIMLRGKTYEKLTL